MQQHAGKLRVLMQRRVHRLWIDLLECALLQRYRRRDLRVQRGIRRYYHRVAEPSDFKAVFRDHRLSRVLLGAGMMASLTSEPAWILDRILRVKSAFRFKAAHMQVCANRSRLPRPTGSCRRPGAGR
eukprot:571606-Rhodomonas_salina.1